MGSGSMSIKNIIFGSNVVMPVFNPNLLPFFARIVFHRLLTPLNHRSWIVFYYSGLLDAHTRSLLVAGWRPWADELGDNEFKFILPWCAYGLGSDLTEEHARQLWPSLMDHWVRVTLGNPNFEVFNTENGSGLGIRATRCCTFYQIANHLEGHLDIIEDDEEAEDSTYFHLKQARHCSLFESIDENGMFINGIVWGPASIANSDIEFFPTKFRILSYNSGR